MELSIDCGVFARLSKLANLNNSGFLRSIWLEKTDGKMIAVATDRKIMAIEFLGEDNGTDFSFNAVVDNSLIAQCEMEKSFNSVLKFSYDHMLDFVTATTTLGYMHPGNGAIRGTVSSGVLSADENLISTWRQCLPEELPKKSTGGMFTTMDKLAILAATSPTGSIIFPEFIDTSKPVVVNDISDPNWIGLFMANTNDNETPDPVTLPKWVW